MKIKKLLLTTATLAVMTTTNANAFSLGIQDAWKLKTTGGTNSNIGNLAIESQGGQIWQEVNSLGQNFIGANFFESAQEFTSSFIPESGAPGANDFGFGTNYAGGDRLTVSISAALGTITDIGLDGSFDYKFSTPQPATFISSLSGNLANLQLIQPSNGHNTALPTTQGSYVGTGNTTATFDVVADLLAGGGLLSTSDSTNLDPYILNPAYNVLFSLNTNNTVNLLGGFFSNALDGFNFITQTACATAGTGDCKRAINLSATGTGHINLFVERVIPEPESIALIGIGLLGMGASLSRRKQA